MKPKLTRRMRRHYDEILQRSPHGVRHMWPHPCAFPGMFPPQYGGSEWAAYMFCKRWKSRSGYNVKKLQRIVIVAGNPEVAYLFARDVPSACLDKLEKVVVEAGDPKWMKLFADLPGARKKILEDFAFLAETMAI